MKRAPPNMKVQLSTRNPVSQSGVKAKPPYPEPQTLNPQKVSKQNDIIRSLETQVHSLATAVETAQTAPVKRGLSPGKSETAATSWARDGYAPVNSGTGTVVRGHAVTERAVGVPVVTSGEERRLPGVNVASW